MLYYSIVGKIIHEQGTVKFEFKIVAVVDLVLDGPDPDPTFQK